MNNEKFKRYTISKYCPEWDTMDPRRQDALINKRWPAEIQCYTEQKDILKASAHKVEA